MKTISFFKLAGCIGLLAFLVSYCSKESDNTPKAEDKTGGVVETDHGVN